MNARPDGQASRPVDSDREPIGVHGLPESVAPKMLKFSELSRCGEEIWIEHNGQLYRLRKTRQDKLILTK